MQASDVVASTGAYIDLKEVSLEKQLLPHEGPFLILPTLLKAGQEGGFHVTLYTDKPIANPQPDNKLEQVGLKPM